MKVDIYTNHIPGGWAPNQLDSGLGGSEEVICLFARELAQRDFQVRVYISTQVAHANTFKWFEVQFCDRSLFDPWGKRDILITWKDHSPWLSGASATRRKIHWSSDAEKPGTWVNSVDWFVNLTEYHQSCNAWVEPDKSKVFPHGIGLVNLNDAKCPKKPNTMLYCSSFDRGLEDLLRRLPLIRQHLPELQLKVAYGWDFIDTLIQGNLKQSSDLAHLKVRIGDSLQQDGVKLVGRVSRSALNTLYWESQYWALPLNRAESEMFCLNAVKAGYCKTLAVVNMVGALQNTVKEWISWEDFYSGKFSSGKKNAAAVPAMDWSEIVEKYWLPIFGTEK